jgi:hypothetical protein
MRLLNFQKKSKNPFSLVDALNTKKNTSLFVSIIFFIIFDKKFWRFFISLKWLIKD